MLSKKATMETLQEVIKQIPERINKECKRLANSGGISTRDQAAWRIILVTALLNEADAWRPLSEELKEQVKNLRHF